VWFIDRLPRNGMHLIPFTEQYHPLLVNWIPDEEFNLLCGGPLYTWLITIEEIASHQAQDEVASFLLTDDGNIVGFIELIREADNSCRLCRIIIAAEAARGRGDGKKLVELAIQYSQSTLGANNFNLAVFERNECAIHCYSSVGFQVTSREEKARQFQGQWWPFLRMEMAL
jgi:RimJ/RimL family protein N-acetyltransferase